MAQTINTSTNNGIFNVGEAEFADISQQEIVADISGCKDPIAVIIQLPSGASGNIICKASETGVSDKTIPLTAGVLNVFYMETKGYKDSKGMAEFNADSSIVGKGAKIAFLKYANVINY